MNTRPLTPLPSQTPPKSNHQNGDLNPTPKSSPKQKLQLHPLQVDTSQCQLSTESIELDTIELDTSYPGFPIIQNSHSESSTPKINNLSPTPFTSDLSPNKLSPIYPINKHTHRRAKSDFISTRLSPVFDGAPDPIAIRLSRPSTTTAASLKSSKTMKMVTINAPIQHPKPPLQSALSSNPKHTSPMKTIASNWNNWYGGGGGSVRSDSSRTDNDTVMENSFLLACERAVVTFLKTVRLYFKSYRLVRLDEHFVSVDQSFYWRRSLVWSHDNGGLLKSHLTQKYSSTTLLATLLLSAEVSVLFSPSDVLEVVRTEALNENGLSFGIVLVMLLDIVATLGTILATFTAWGTVGAVSDRNIHAITRSAIGLYATQLPTTLLMFSFYLFCAWVTMLLYKLVPNKFAILITALLVFMTWHIVSTFSIFGRIILHSNAMSEIAIFPREEEEEMMPVPLFENLLEKTKENMDIPIAIQYRRNLKRALKKGDDWTVIQRHKESRRNIRSVHKRRHTIALPGDGTETFKTQSKDEENEHCVEPTFVDLPQSLRKIGGNITQVSSDFTVLTGLTRGSGDDTGVGIDVIDPDVDGGSMKSFNSASPLTLDSLVHNTTKQL